MSPTTSTERPAELGAAPFACVAAIGLGSSLVLSSGDALFLHRVGAQHLGLAFAVSSALLVAVLSFVGARADRGGRDALVLVIAVISAALLCGSVALSALSPKVTAIFVLIGGKQMAAALELAVWVLLAERFDARQLRRALPRLIAANGVGLALGAAIVALAAPRVGVPALTIAGALAFVLAGFAGRSIGKSGALRPLPRAEVRGAGLGLGAGLAAVKSSPVSRVLVLLVVLGGATVPIVHYVLGARAASEFAGEASLATFFGTFRALVSVLTLAAQALLAARFMHRLGVGTSLVCAPALIAGAAVAMFIRPELAAVVVAQALIRVVDGAIETPAHKLAQNLTRRELRGRIGGFLDGVAKRVGATVGGILAAVLSHAAVVVALGLISIAWLLAALVFRARFPSLAVRELSSQPTGWTGDDDVEIDRGGVAALRAALHAGGAASHRARVLLAELDGSGVDYSAELARAITAVDRRVGALLAVELGERLDCGRAGSPRPEDLAYLAASDDEALRLISARYGVSGLGDSSAVVAAGAELAQMRGEGALPLASFGDGDLFDRELCRALAEGALDADDEMRASRRLLRLARAQGLRARAALIALRLYAERRRRAAAVSHEASAEWLLASSSLVELAEALTGGGAPALQAAALELLGVAGGVRAAPEIARYLGSSDRAVARSAAAALRRMGAEAIDALLRAAVFGRRRARGPALSLLRELRVPPSEIDTLAREEAAMIGASAQRLPLLLRLEGGSLLARRVGERITESAHTLFLLLEARSGQRAIGRAARRLRHARHQAARARAMEALDAALPRRFVGVLEALDGARAEPREPSETAVRRAVRAEIAGEDRLARRIAIFALGESGRSELAPEITAAARDAYSQTDPDEVAARLVSLLGGSDNAPDEMSRSIESLMVLSELPLFVELTTRELAELAEVVSWVNARAGDVLISEGEVGDAMFFVVDGEVVVERKAADGERLLAVLGRGEPFGEMALFEDEVRSATVTAERPARLGRIERPAFEEIVAEVPGIALGICRALSRRVRNLE